MDEALDRRFVDRLAPKVKHASAQFDPSSSKGYNAFGYINGGVV